MRDFRKQRGTNRSMLSFWLALGGFFAVLLLLGFSVRAAWGMYTKFIVASRGHEAAQHELSNLKKQYTRVSAAVETLSTLRGEESELRERFGVARPGEGAIQIIRSSTSTDSEESLTQKGFWSKILQVFFVK